MTTLRPDDEFEAALIRMVEMHRFKAGVYGSDDDPFQNFYTAAVHLATTPLAAAIMFHGKHEAKLTKWLQDDQPDGAPGMEDMFIDRAVYSVIELVLWERRQRNGRWT